MSTLKHSDPIPVRAAAYVALYPMLHSIAKEHGYALAVHGSVHRDFDLIAAPWTDGATDALTLIKALKVATSSVTTHEEVDEHKPDCDPRPAPHGRVAYALHCTNRGMYGGYFDISVMPRLSAAYDAAMTATKEGM